MTGREEQLFARAVEVFTMSVEHQDFDKAEDAASMALALGRSESESADR